jgi:hypothetical protein
MNMEVEEEKKTEVKSPLQGEYQAIDSQYRRDVALLDARPWFERIGLVLWGMVDAILLIVFVIAVPTYIVSGSFTDVRSAARVVSNAAQTHALSLAQAPESLTLGSARALTGETGTTDFLADATNPNAEWYVTFSYSFAYDGGETDRLEGFLNPHESRPLATLHVTTSGLARNPRLILEDFAWHRVDRHAISDTEAFLETHIDFPVSNMVTTNDIVLEHGSVGRTDFTVLNHTPYSYWAPEFLITLTRGGVPVAVTEATLSQFVSGESRPVSVRWFQPIPEGATVKVTPVLNYFDPTVYMRPAGE